MQNRKTIFILFSGLALFGLLGACESNQEEQRLKEELEALKNTRHEDSLSLRHLQSEMSSINNQLNRINLLDMELHQTSKLSKMDALEKIAQIENILEKSDAQIHGLEMKLKNENPSIAELGTSLFVFDKKEELARQREYIQELKKEIENLETKNVNLQKAVHQRENQLVERNYTINQKDYELKELSKQSQKMQNELDSLKKLRTKFESSMDFKIGLIYYQEGLSLLKNLDNVKASHRKKQLKRAYGQFLLAQSFKNPDAQYQIKVIETKKEYNKYLDK